MNQEVFAFLKANHVCVLTILLSDGTPHSATVHYSIQEDPFQMLFSTDKTSRKCEGLSENSTSKASVVIGFSEEEWKTFQLEGTISIITDDEKLAAAKKIHYAIHPKSQEFENDPDTVFLAFTPTWWKYTDFNTKPPTVIEMT